MAKVVLTFDKPIHQYYGGLKRVYAHLIGNGLGAIKSTLPISRVDAGSEPLEIQDDDRFKQRLSKEPNVTYSLK